MAPEMKKKPFDERNIQIKRQKLEKLKEKKKKTNRVIKVELVNEITH
jgi:hypothetical protein